MTTPQDAGDAIVAELTTLIRGLKDLHRLPVEAGHDSGPGPAAFVVLWRLAESGAARPGALAGAVGVDASTLTRQLAPLEHAGWVSRAPDPSDARACLVALTAAGRAALEHARVRRAEALAEALADWSDDDRTRLAAELARLNASLHTFRAAHPAARPAPPSKETS